MFSSDDLAARTDRAAAAAAAAQHGPVKAEFGIEGAVDAVGTAS